MISPAPTEGSSFPMDAPPPSLLDSLGQPRRVWPPAVLEDVWDDDWQPPPRSRLAYANSSPPDSQFEYDVKTEPYERAQSAGFSPTLDDEHFVSFAPKREPLDYDAPADDHSDLSAYHSFQLDQKHGVEQAFDSRPSTPLSLLGDSSFVADGDEPTDKPKEEPLDSIYALDNELEVVGDGKLPPVINSWTEAGFSPEILRNIEAAGFVRPRNFQRFAIPSILDGHDVKGQAETGTGKSAAFLLPIVQRLSDELGGSTWTERLHQCSALIIEPTREMAIQLTALAKKLAEGTGVLVNAAYGDYHLNKNKEAIHRHGCDVLIGTPGRLKQLLRENFVKYEKLLFFVLDEADFLLDSHFAFDVQDMLKLPNFPKPEQRQTLFFSATFPPEICDLASTLCKPDALLIRNTKNDLNQRIEQEILEVPFDERKTFLFGFLKQLKEDNGGEMPKTLMFVEGKRDADLLAGALCLMGISSHTVNSDRTQQQREEVTRFFRTGAIRTLVSTNVFARGLDIRDLDHVINVHLPADRTTYVNRIGRTGRLRSGKATTFFDPQHPADQEMAQTIIDELTRANQEVPAFLIRAVEAVAEQPLASGNQPLATIPELSEPEFD